MNRPTFSLVIPAYNAAATIGDAIRSVLNQTVADFEVIVVDDGSTDATSTEIARFAGDPRVRPFRQPNGGVSAARNRALAEACGRYASFLDADDLLLPRYLEVMGHTLDRIPEAAVADCDFWILHDADGAVSCSPAGHLELPAAPDELMRVLLKRNVLHYATTVRMDVLRDVGAFDPALRAAEDLELWLRILAHGQRVVRAPGRLCVWRSSGGSLSTDSALLTRSLCEVYRRVADDYDVPDDLRQLARVRMRAERKRLGALTGDRRLAGALRRMRVRLAKMRRLLRMRRRPSLPPEIAELVR